MYAKRVRYDQRKRVVEQTEPTGLTTSTTWDDEDRVIATEEPGGLRTTTRYDAAGRPTDRWGPAPSGRFNSDGTPNHPGVPNSQTRYDEGFQGLAATYWSNPYLAGLTARHGLGMGPTASLDVDWATTPPITPDANGDWSARFDGEVTLAAAGEYRFNLQTKGTARVVIDDQVVVEHAGPEPTTGWAIADSDSGFVNAVAGSKHRMRVDSTGPLTGAASTAPTACCPVRCPITSPQGWRRHLAGEAAVPPRRPRSPACRLRRAVGWVDDRRCDETAPGPRRGASGRDQGHRLPSQGQDRGHLRLSGPRRGDA